MLLSASSPITEDDMNANPKHSDADASDSPKPILTKEPAAPLSAMDDLLARLDSLPVPGAKLSTMPSNARVDLARFDPAGMQRVAEIAATVSLEDSASAMTFGVEPQNRANSHLDRLMGDMRAYEAGVAGDLTIELSHGLSALNLPRLRRESNGKDWVANSFGRIPVIGRYFSALRHLQVSQNRVIDLMGKIEGKAQAERVKLSANHAQMDKLVDATLENIRDLEFYLAAGDLVVERFRHEFEQKKAAARESQDPIALAKLRDLNEQCSAFETRLLRMHIAYADSLVSVPEIRLTQEAARIEMCNIMDSILFDMPRLKRAIIRVASLAQISRAHKNTQARKDLARKLSAMGSEALQEAYVAAKSTQGDGVNDVADLSMQADKMLETLSLGLRMDEENARKRDAAHKSLGELKAKLQAGFIAHGERLSAAARR